VVAALVVVASQWAAAQVPDAIVTAVPEQSCAGTRFGRDLGCTAGEFSVNLAFTQPSANRIESCTAGETITVDVLSSINAPNTNRYDVAIFFGEDGNDPRVNDPNQTCSVAVFPLAPDPPFFNLTPTTNNVCGDYRQGVASVLLVQDVTLRCVAQPGSGQVTVPTLLSYENNQNASLNDLICDASNVVPGTTSKCSSTGVSGTLDVFVNAWLRLTKVTAPGGRTESFAFTATASATTLPPAEPSSFSLADGDEQLVAVRLAANGTRTLVVEEAVLDGWGPDAAIVCTSPTGGSAASYVTVDTVNRRITATLSSTNFGAECTVTNTRQTRVRTSKSLEPTTDPGRFNLTAAGFTESSQGDGGTTGYRVVAAGTAVTFSETAAPGTDLADYQSSYLCVDDLGGDVLASGEGASVTLTPPAHADTTCTFTNTPRTADLALVKLVDLSGPEPSDLLTYTLHVTNNGPATATNVIVTDTLPTGVTFVSASAECTDLAGVVTCAVAELPAAATAAFDVVVEIDDGLALGTLLSNDASVEGDQPDPVPDNDLASAVVTVSGLVLTKGVCNLTSSACAAAGDYLDSVTGAPGDVLEYRVVYLRVGPPVFDLVLEDDVPANTVLVTDAYGPGADVELTCPDGAVVLLSTGLVSTVSVELADVCGLALAPRADGTLAGAIQDGDAGALRFRVRVP
jgi:uncharacterized repeat protein (TIGR01451 family)